MGSRDQTQVFSLVESIFSWWAILSTLILDILFKNFSHFIYFDIQNCFTFFTCCISCKVLSTTLFILVFILVSLLFIIFAALHTLISEYFSFQYGKFVYWVIFHCFSTYTMDSFYIMHTFFWWSFEGEEVINTSSHGFARQSVRRQLKLTLREQYSFSSFCNHVSFYSFNTCLVNASYMWSNETEITKKDIHN